MNSSFVIKSDFVYNKSLNELKTIKDGYLVCEEGIIKGIYNSYPKEYADLEFFDYSNKLTIPGMIDLHIHAPQFAFRGMYMDEQLMDWLKKYAYKEESKYADLDYAEKAYTIFCDSLRKSATTRACVFATSHREPTLLLMKKMEESGLISYVGKINMDKEAPEEILDKSALSSAFNTIGWINDSKEKFKRTFPILTPRFIISCSKELLNELKEISHIYDIPIQSHLSENKDEIKLVHELMPEVKTYGHAYDKYDLFGLPNKTIMAHCVYSCEKEVALMKENGVFIAHCPSSNLNLGSGIAPIHKYLKLGLNVGLGSDVAGGESESIFEEIKKAIEISKMYNLYIDNEVEKLSFVMAFYMATKGGGQFFGDVGSFEKGYEADLVVLDDEKEKHPQELDIKERLERAIYLRTDKDRIVAKFVKGRKII